MIMASSAGGRTCRVTGLQTVAQPTAAWRVFQETYGPLNPKILEPSDKIGRYDCSDSVTIYAASTRRGAIEEVLAYLKPADPHYDRIFDDIERDENPVLDEWKQGGISPSRADIFDWALGRGIATLVITDGTYIDIAAAQTIGTLRQAATEWLADRRLVVDLSLLTSDNREATCSAASWIRDKRLEDGSTPAGLRYPSKHGADHECWAIWVPLLGARDQVAVPRLASERVRVQRQESLQADDSDLSWAVNALGWPATP